VSTFRPSSKTSGERYPEKSPANSGNGSKNGANSGQISSRAFAFSSSRNSAFIVAQAPNKNEIPAAPKTRNPFVLIASLNIIPQSRRFPVNHFPPLGGFRNSTPSYFRKYSKNEYICSLASASGECSGRIVIPTRPL